MNLGAIDPSLVAYQANLGQSLGLTKEQATSAKQTFSDYLDKSMASLNQSMAIVNDGTKEPCFRKGRRLGPNHGKHDRSSVELANGGSG